jgi:lipopolysaccharide/colanic/teichoic acid biosynthesis glycosyltransferase
MFIYSNYNLIIKRVIDLLLSAILLIVLMPVILISALLIFLESKGNPIFMQKRLGKNGNSFTIYKIRTLYKHHFGLFPEKDHVDNYRISPIGKYLRRSKVDELPQLFNILIGNMSFVGPRPYTPLDFDRCLRIKRVSRKPGLTGLAQISGNITLGKTNTAWMDLWYIQNHSLWLDTKILFYTPASILNGDNNHFDPFNLYGKLPVKNYIPTG